VSQDQLREHGSYVADAIKVDAYRQALNSVIEPGDVVIDLGCGSGLLGMLALEAGAGKVIAVDDGPILELARETFERNGFADRVECHRTHSSDLTLSTPADVLVCDQIGGFAHEVSLTHAVKDLLDRGVLKPDGKILPCSFDLFVAPVCVPADDDPMGLWKASSSGFDLEPFQRSAANTPFRLHAEADWLLGHGVKAAELEAFDEGNIEFDVVSQIHTSGVVTGILGFMRAYLDHRGGVALTNDPTDAEHVRRWHLYHPVEPHLAVKVGDEITMKLVINQRGRLTNWQAKVGTEVRSASQFFGDFLDPLVMFDPSGIQVPPLTRRGQCQRAVLDAVDSGSSFDQIAELVTSEFRDLFSTPDLARRYARDTVARYCERG
jgi:SAM-dependent methyltransferase